MGRNGVERYPYLPDHLRVNSFLHFYNFLHFYADLRWGGRGNTPIYFDLCGSLLPPHTFSPPHTLSIKKNRKDRGVPMGFQHFRLEDPARSCDKFRFIETNGSIISVQHGRVSPPLHAERRL